MKRSQIIHEFKLFLDYWGIRKEYLEEMRKGSDIPFFYKTIKHNPPYDYITHLFDWDISNIGYEYWYIVYLLWDIKLKELGVE